MYFIDDSKKNLSISNTIEQEDDDEEDEEDNDEVWRNEFMDFMSRLIGYSEELESISFELLRTEGKVRKLILLQKTILEELEETERMYIDRINECERISDRQNEYMNELINLDAELTSSSSVTTKKVSNKRMTTNSASTLGWKSSEYSQRTRSTTSTNTTVDSKYLIYKSDAVNTFKWKLGTWIGGGVGNGNLIHAYHHPVHQRLELIVVGSGTIATQYENVSYRYFINLGRPNTNLSNVKYSLIIFINMTIYSILIIMIVEKDFSYYQITYGHLILMLLGVNLKLIIPSHVQLVLIYYNEGIIVENVVTLSVKGIA